MAKKSKQTGKKRLENLEPAGLVFSGVVRPGDGDAIMFAHRGSSKWVKLHNDQIADIKLVQEAHQGKKGYPLVHLVMKPPQSKEGRTFAGLAQLHGAAASLPGEPDMCFDSATGKWVPCKGPPRR